MALSESTRERIYRVQTLVIRGIKKFLTFILSHVGLTVAVAGYGMFGGILFQALEAPHEEEQRLKVVEARNKLNKQLLELSESVDVVADQKKWSEQAEILLMKFQDETYSLTEVWGWDGMEVGEELQWSFAGALLFAVTVITTIGYGHIAPKTAFGRIVTILYALFGIPLTLLCLRNIGTLLSACVRLFYKYTCIKLLSQYKLCRKRIYHSRRLKYLSEIANKRGLHLRLLDGRAELVAKEDEPEEACLEEAESEGQQQEITVPNVIGSHVSISQVVEKLTKEADDAEVRVPVILTFLILAGYIVGGAIMFGLWEKDWDILIGSYFCFITLSTIGFGDFVPGTTSDSWSNQEKNIICCVYLLFGMAIMAMCFHLIQEEVKLKCRRLAERIGLFKEELVKNVS